jgi:hypothetical protein
MHFECGSIRDESVVSICEECCERLGNVDNISGRVARREELEARIAPLYEMIVSDPRCWFT